MTRILAAALFLAIVVLAFMVGRVSSAPRSSAVSIPAASFVPVLLSGGSPRASEPDPWPTTGAPLHPTPASTQSAGPVASPEPVVAPPAVAGSGRLSGIASWYDDGPGLYAAVHSYRWGDPRYPVRVCAGSRCVTVVVRDFCGCPDGRVIDLSPEAFAALAPLSRGLVRVTVRWP